MDCIVEKSLNGKTVKVYYDNHNPREEMDKFGQILYLKKSRYVLGDRATDSGEIDYLSNSDEYISLPVYAMVHSNVRLSTQSFGCPWDSGQSGIIYVSKNQVLKEMGWDELTDERVEKIKEMLVSEVKFASNCLDGQVFYFVLENDSGEVLDSCGGIVEDPEKIADDVLNGRF